MKLITLTIAFVGFGAAALNVTSPQFYLKVDSQSRTSQFNGKLRHPLSGAQIVY